MTRLSRRRLLQLAGTSAIALTAASRTETRAEAYPAAPPPKPFRYALNFGTLLGFKLPIEEEVDLAAKAGYDGIEPWSAGLDKFLQKGGKLSDLRKRIDDHGLKVVGGCAFFPWIVNDDEARTKGIERMKREMDWFREIGGTHLAAPPLGATNERLDDFAVLGERYRTILDIGLEREIVPQLEVWGRSRTLNCLADAAAVAIHSGRAKADLLLDVFHLYRGGSSFESLALVNGRNLSVFHLNDYPVDPPRDQIEDKHRVYPGDGIAPLTDILRTLRAIGFDGFLSLELFNPTYWSTGDPLGVARTGLEKMRAIA